MSGDKLLSGDQLAKVRESMPTLDEHVWAWVYAFTGVKIARNAVCQGHSAPLAMFVEQVLTRPPISLWHGPRGGGKSFLSALDTHLTSRFNPRHGTRILGGSKAQSAQIYEAIRDAVRHGRGPLGSDAESIASLLKTEALYVNGSNVSILAASSTSVRGPHIPSLKLDEVDEIPADLRESATGMAMSIRGQRSSILMTSTWHRMAGPMAGLVAQGAAGEFPVHTFCSFEILERCPDERSGPNLEHCPNCPLMPWCHSDYDGGYRSQASVGTGAASAGHAQGEVGRPARFDRDPGGRIRTLPKAKRADGHYAIDSLIQKVRAVSPRVFVSDYLCGTPVAANVWFTRFDSAQNVTGEAEYVPGHPVHCAVDCGVWTGAVLFQVFRDGLKRRVNVFGEYLAKDPGAGQAALDILDMIQARAPDAKADGLLRVSADQAGNAATPIGVTVFAEYEAAGLVGSGGIEGWDRYPGSVNDTLTHVEGMVCAADGSRSLFIHPRCSHLIAAFHGYERKVVDNQLTDDPKDPQHPDEEMIDSLRGGLSVEFPTRRVEPKPARALSARRIFK